MKRVKSIIESLSILESKYSNKYKKATGKYKGFKTDHTGMSYYDQFFDDPEYMRSEKHLVSEIVEMTPRQYLDEMTNNIFHNDYESSWGYIYDDDYEMDHINELADKIKSGTQLNTPLLDYANEVQEGRHRAVAALELGIDKIPVMIVEELSKEDKIKELTKYYKKLRYSDSEINDIIRNMKLESRHPISESFTSEFINDVSKLADRSILVEINELLESLEVTEVNDIEPKLEGLKKVTVYKADDRTKIGIYNKLNNSWKHVKNAIKELIY